MGQTTITGNLLQTSTGTLVPNLASATNTSDHLQVNGEANLAGAVDVVLADPSNLRTGTRQTAILSATDGVVRTGPLTVSAGTPVLSYGLASPNANTLDLTYTVDFSGALALGAVGLSTANREAVGRALNAIFAENSDALGPLAGELAMLENPQTLATALDILSGEGVADVQQTVFTTQQAYASTVLHHVTTSADGAGGGDASYAVASLGPATSASAARDQGLRVWVGGFGISDNLDSTDGLASLHTQVAGGLVGLDKWFDPGRMVGFSIGGGSTEFSIADRATQGSTTSAHLSVYGLARFGQAYLSGVLAYGNFASDLNRMQLANATGLSASAHASLSTNVLGGRVEAGWRHPLGAVTVTPFAALEVDQLWQAPLTESAYLGSGQVSALSLHFAGQSQTSVPLTLGVRVGGNIHLGGKYVLGVSAEAGWVHEFDRQRTLAASFVAAPDFPFEVIGAGPSEDSALTAVDANLPLTRNVALFANATGRFSGVETAIGGFGGVRVRW